MSQQENLDLRETERATLSTFRQLRPSEYFSHIEHEYAFHQHHAKVEKLYRFGLNLPPEFFKHKSVIDLGAGTGEHTISLALWGATCHLVEINDDALQVARRVFNQKVGMEAGHSFHCMSLYDLDLKSMRESFDFSHSRGVFTHTANKAGAFRILAELAKPGGYVIYGDRNTAGGLQEMLQRYAIYSLSPSGSASDICLAAEALFSADIDRSHRSVPRTREAIIFDRWVIQQQDDPSVAEVLSFMESNGLEYVSSWPRIEVAGRGDSTHSEPRNWSGLKRGAALTETLWMLLNHGEEETLGLQMPESTNADFFERLEAVTQVMRNLQLGTPLRPEHLRSEFRSLAEVGNTFWDQPIRLRNALKDFCSEVDAFLAAVDGNRSLSDVRSLIDSFTILFKGHVGVRHVDYVAYKPPRVESSLQSAMQPA